MKPVEGSISLVESPDTCAPAAPPGTYLGVAHHLMLGATTLAGSAAGTEFASAFLCGQALECMLKAFLSHSGVAEKTLRSDPMRHDLDRLWELAELRGLGCPQAAFPWARQLSQLHRGSSFLLRYSTGMNAISVPAPGPMTTDLNTLLTIIRGKVVS